MSKLCQGLNHLDRITARLIYEQRLAENRPATRDAKTRAVVPSRWIASGWTIWIPSVWSR